MRTDDPIRDAENYANREPETIGDCEACGRPIYSGDAYYDIKGILIHDEFECYHDWLSQFKQYE